VLRHGGANPSFSTLTPSFFETRIESDNLLLPGVAPSRSVPLCPLLNVSSIPRFDLLFLDSFFCAPLPLPSLSVSLALLHQPVVHRPILHPAPPPPPAVSCRRFIFFPAFNFSCSCIFVSHLPCLAAPSSFLSFFVFPPMGHAVWSQPVRP